MSSQTLLASPLARRAESRDGGGSRGGDEEPGGGRPRRESDSDVAARYFSQSGPLRSGVGPAGAPLSHRPALTPSKATTAPPLSPVVTRDRGGSAARAGSAALGAIDASVRIRRAQAIAWTGDGGVGSPDNQPTSGGKLVTAYQIEVVMSGASSEQWSVWKRYSQFQALNEALSAVLPPGVLPRLPGKKLLTVFRSDGFIEERRLALERFLQLLTTHPSVWACDQFVSFLDSPQRTLAMRRSAERVDRLRSALLKISREHSQVVQENKLSKDLLASKEKELHELKARMMGSPLAALAAVRPSDVPAPAVGAAAAAGTSPAAPASADGVAVEVRALLSLPSSKLTALAFDRFDALLSWVSPNVESERERLAVFGFVQSVVRRALGAQVFLTGSFPIKLYLPDADLDCSAFLARGQEESWFLKLQAAFCVYASQGFQGSSPSGLPSRSPASAGAATAAGAGPFIVGSVTFVNAHVRVVRIIVNNLTVDVSANCVSAVATAAALEAADAAVGRDHLFKRSLLLIKAWCLYESGGVAPGLEGGILGSHLGSLSTFALDTLVLALFNGTVSPLGASLRHPLQALALFFDVYASWDWEASVLTVHGRVRASTMELAAPLGPPTLPPSFFESFVRLQHDGGASSDGGAKSGEKGAAATAAPVAEPSCATASGAGPRRFLRYFPCARVNIMDPICAENNLGRSVSRKGLERMKRALEGGRQRLNALLRWMVFGARDADPSLRASSLPPAEPADHPASELRSFLAELEALFGATWSRLASGDGFRPDLLRSPMQEKVYRAAGGLLPFKSGLHRTDCVLEADAEQLQSALAYASFALASVVTPEALRLLVSQILEEKRCLPVGEIGKLLTEATGNTTVSAHLKEKFGGLKVRSSLLVAFFSAARFRLARGPNRPHPNNGLPQRFIEQNPDLFTVLDDHPFNPSVTLLADGPSVSAASPRDCSGGKLAKGAPPTPPQRRRKAAS